MSELSFLALAFGLGLLGFVEPCSLGANGIFLSYLRKKDRNDRLLETAKFALSRSAVLGLFGIGVSFLDSFVFSAQKGFWLFLGLLYLVLGVAVMLDARFRWTSSASSLQSGCSPNARTTLWGWDSCLASTSLRAPTRYSWPSSEGAPPPEISGASLRSSSSARPLSSPYSLGPLRADGKIFGCLTRLV